MSRHAAATTAGRTHAIARTPAPALPRRVSGPAAPNRRDDERRPAAPRHAFPAPNPRRLAYGGVAIASRVAGVAVDVSASRLMDRLVRSRVWIGVVAFALIGLVVLQVSMLKLNSGIGRAVQTASTLERSNAALHGEISRLSAGDRIQRLAEAQGLVMPAPSDIAYLRAANRNGDAARAAQRMRPPDPAGVGPAGTVTNATLPAATTAPAATVAGGTAVPPAAGPATTSATSAPTTASATTPATVPAATGAAPAPAEAGGQSAATGATAQPTGGASPQQATAATP